MINSCSNDEFIFAEGTEYMIKIEICKFIICIRNVSDPFFNNYNKGNLVS